MRTNSVSAQNVLESRLLRYLLIDAAATPNGHAPKR